ncbi:MAG TPA: TRAP transporter large permease subunit [Firmicutes bacterium]|jgi:tripartite ATP-independent transporter DctM subunit|nr:TRAP transporter large permease subunit [Bacillota bacterium]
MDSGLIIAIFIGGLIILLALRVPVFISLMLVSLAVSIKLFGTEPGSLLIVRTVFSSVRVYYLVTIPLFALMGDLLFESGIAMGMIKSISALMGGGFRGRLCVIAIVAGTLFGVLSGSSLAATAMIGSLMIPDMVKSGYSKSISVGSVMGAGGMSMVIPPSGVAIIVGTFGQMSIGKLLIGGIVPGIILAFFNILVIVLWAVFIPSAAPKYEVQTIELKERLRIFAVNILPILSLMILLLLAIFYGVATPNEAAGLGVIGALAMVILYRKFSWGVLKRSLDRSVRLTGMIFMVMASASAYTQLLTLTGATKEFVNSVMALPLSPVGTMLMMIGILVLLGCFFEPISLIMLVLPLYLPVAISLGYNPIWFGLLFLINTDLADLTPPFGLYLFTMKGLLPKSFTMIDIYKGAIPFAMADLATILCMLAFPSLFTWLPSLM